MAVQLDHFIVPCRDQVAAARKLAEILGVPWAEKGMGPFSPVYVNDGLTLDFIQTDEAFPVHHYAFRVSEHEFDAIFGRIQASGVDYYADPHQTQKGEINHDWGGRGVYWADPDGQWLEILTVPYGGWPT